MTAPSPQPPIAVADAPTASQDPVRGGAFSQGFRGAGYMLSGFGVLLSGKGMMRWALLPILISLALLVGALVAAGFWADDVLLWLWPGAQELWSVLFVLLAVVVFALLGLIGYLLVLALAPVLAGPFMDILSEKTEAMECGQQLEGEFQMVIDLAGASHHVRPALGETNNRQSGGLDDAHR